MFMSIFVFFSSINGDAAFDSSPLGVLFTIQFILEIGTSSIIPKYGIEITRDIQIKYLWHFQITNIGYLRAGFEGQTKE